VAFGTIGANIRQLKPIGMRQASPNQFELVILVQQLMRCEILTDKF